MTTITPQQYAQLTALGYIGRRDAHVHNAIGFFRANYSLYITGWQGNEKYDKCYVTVWEPDNEIGNILFTKDGYITIDEAILSGIDFCINHIIIKNYPHVVATACIPAPYGIKNTLKTLTLTLHTTTECQAAFALSQRMLATYNLLSPSDVEFYHQLTKAIETFKNKHS